MNKPYNRLKLSGSVALLLSVIGVLLAVGGQLDFIGQERPQTATATVKPQSVPDVSQPKYSFYEDLKKRKTELNEAQKQQIAAQTNTDPMAEVYRYMVQIGAFSRQTDADKIKQRAKAMGFSVKIVKGGSKYLVQTGPFRGKTAANTAEKTLQAAKFPTLIRRIK